MKQVILTVGPQHIGKSTFCNKVITLNPEITLVSRDAILTELFGSAYLDSYSNGHFIALEKMWEIMESHLKEKDKTIILDCWNGPNKERKNIVESIRKLGATRIGAWYFITPRKVCLNWHMQETVRSPAKSPKWEKIRRKCTKLSFLEFYDFFYENAIVDTTQGFDFVVKVNPLKPFSLKSLLAQN